MYNKYCVHDNVDYNAYNNLMLMVLFHLQNGIFLCDEVLHNVKDVRLVQGVDVNLVLTLQHRRCPAIRAKER